jgi:hypothetical protein
MLRMHLRQFAVAVAILLIVQTAALADYIDAYAVMVGPGQQSQGVAFPGGDPPGAVRIQAYDGKGASGGGLQAGEVPLTFWADGGLAAPMPGQTLGLQSVAFNTDLSLSAAQIQLPAGWHSSANPAIITAAPGPVYTFGTFTWGAGTASNIENGISVLITGLGANANPSHFLLGSSATQTPPPPFESAVFAANEVSQSFGVEVSSDWLATNANGINGGPPVAPEPCALVLASLGVAGLLGRQAIPRRRLCRH